MSEVLFLKWSPNVKEQFYEKSKLKEKHKAIGNNVMETILQEGNEFVNNKTRENQFERMNQREIYVRSFFIMKILLLFQILCSWKLACIIKMLNVNSELWMNL